MKKTLNLFILFITTVLIVGCAKSPFKAQKPFSNSALVYVYVMPDVGINDTNRNAKYAVYLNDKSMEDEIEILEYMSLNVKPEILDIKVVRGNLEAKKMSLDLKSGKTYYLKIQSFSDGFGKYSFKEVKQEEALKDLYQTTNVLKEKKQSVKEVLVIDKNKEELKKSKTQKIKEAYELKKDGIITDEEFQKLKAEILDAK